MTWAATPITYLSLHYVKTGLNRSPGPAAGSAVLAYVYETALPAVPGPHVVRKRVFRELSALHGRQSQLSARRPTENGLHTRLPMERD
jgi:hypothetical protein